MKATGDSLGSLCQAVDFIADGLPAGSQRDCCSNADNNMTFCVERTFAVGQVTSPGTPGQCESDDVSCQ